MDGKNFDGIDRFNDEVTGDKSDYPESYSEDLSGAENRFEFDGEEQDDFMLQRLKGIHNHDGMSQNYNQSDSSALQPVQGGDAYMKDESELYPDDSYNDADGEFEQTEYSDFQDENNEAVGESSVYPYVSDTIQINSIERFTHQETVYSDIPDDQFSSPKKKNTLSQAEKREIKKAQRRKSRQRTFGHILGGVILAVCIVSFSVFLGFFIVDSAVDFTGIGVTEFDVEVEIPEYATTEQVASILKEHGLISNPKLFEIYAKISKVENKYLTGLFTLSSTMSYSKIIDTLQTVVKQRQTVTVRIVEGMTAADIGKMLEENQVCRAEDFTQFYREKMNEYSFEKRVLEKSLKFNQLEGYLFPDTYEFFITDELADNPDMDTSEEARVAAKKIYSNFNQKITIPIYQRINEMGLTLDEAITLASMVQAEAGTVEDMKLVASVFLNRLHNRETYPNLQSDASFTYINNSIKPYFEDEEDAAYQSIAAAYNSYVAEGIPAGPICNPGMDAIEAVLYAPETDYYYFCSNTETYEMYYASTIEQHEQNLITAGLIGIG